MTTSTSVGSQQASSEKADAYINTLISLKGDETKYPFPVIEDAKKRIEDVLEIDAKGEDNHVPRDPRLLRLTGAHPFNAEAPLSLLYDTGFLTPAAIHFVRNHGPVPKVQDEEILNWEISIEGMVQNPMVLTLRDLISEFTQYTVPITLVCAGNRRKEQNMVKKGAGFNWGAAGISNSLWTGAMLGDVIRKAKPHRKARFVWMEGADNPANGAYGTCVRLPWVLDPERSIMLAYKQNGCLLEPDHGKPLRVVIPGVIGGRSVKWLKKLIVAETPSTNWYHYFDNKVLPTMVTPEEAKANKEWWKDERYTVYNLNIQSIIVYPENRELMQFKDINSESNETYPVRGFAYNGGGIRVGRVEISLDRGKSWRLAEIDYPEDKYRDAGIFELFGGEVNVCERMSYLCWCFWKIDVKKIELKNAKDIVVRAMDENMCVQPRDMYWNVTSMLNNWWYRVAVQSEENGAIRFEHPVHATKGGNNGGWMDRIKAEGGNILSRTWGEKEGDDNQDENEGGITQAMIDFEMMTNPEKLNIVITKEELSKHSTETDCWFVVNGQVYDGVPYLDEHPGGAQSITLVAGEDATDDFMAIHSDNAKKALAKFHLGALEGSEKTEKAPSNHDSVNLSPTFLEPKKWKKAKLLKREEISPDSRIFSFELEHSEQTSGLPVGQHLFIRYKDSKGLVMRAYTPKSCHRTKGVLEILIKVYFPKGNIPGGRMTMLLENLKIGDHIEVKGPIGEFEYHGYGEFTINKETRKTKSFLMVSGGSGLTPCYQVFKEIVTNPEDSTEVDFYFGNRNKIDILCKEEIDQYVKLKPSTFRVNYVLSSKEAVADQSWKGLTGYIDSGKLDNYAANRKYKDEDFMVLICGPPAMNDGVKEWARRNNVPDKNIFCF
ncbi:hypothetical protein PACTADRAFT_2564 [Pachysolen tannophilus NRRL Y-2460]|uniref:Nitrate reductase n=1 Tax=Pachysolen tannophilus NRRL Y-2460 TaxID=669874 RepID=A0A1E4TWV2_PACTA|nr:hypothetical protein PACTADRAFT_2564 [Pachysolen tannophilus NRRL Y-2460]